MSFICLYLGCKWLTPVWHPRDSASNPVLFTASSMGTDKPGGASKGFTSSHCFSSDAQDSVGVSHKFLSLKMSFFLTALQGHPTLCLSPSIAMVRAIIFVPKHCFELSTQALQMSLQCQHIVDLVTCRSTTKTKSVSPHSLSGCRVYLTFLCASFSSMRWCNTLVQCLVSSTANVCRRAV